MIDDETSTIQPESNSTSQQQPSFQFKGGLIPLTQLELFEYDYRAFNQRLSKMVKKAPSFFRDMPVIINLERLRDEEDTIDFIELTEVCQAYGIYPIAIRGGSEDQLTAALVAGLPLIPANPTHKAFHQRLSETPSPDGNTPSSDRPATNQNSPVKSAVKSDAVKAAAAPEPTAPTAPTASASDSTNRPSSTPSPETSAAQRAPAKIIRHAVRSGQQVYAPRGDLIVIGSVSAGAEILADGNIHVYGSLRGRALAGVKGDTEAHIFCQKLEAELLSIAGHYKMDEDLQRANWQKSVHATLDGKRLKIEAT